MSSLDGKLPDITSPGNNGRSSSTGRISDLATHQYRVYEQQKAEIVEQHKKAWQAQKAWVEQHNEAQKAWIAQQEILPEFIVTEPTPPRDPTPEHNSGPSSSRLTPEYSRPISDKTSDAKHKAKKIPRKVWRVELEKGKQLCKELKGLHGKYLTTKEINDICDKYLSANSNYKKAKTGEDKYEAYRALRKVNKESQKILEDLKEDLKEDEEEVDE